jgi:hypothetical protein
MASDDELTESLGTGHQLSPTGVALLQVLA